jgi:hypothetical protein
MPPKVVIDELKSKYSKIYVAYLDSREVVFRPLTLKEISDFADHVEWSSAEAEEVIVRAAVVWPINFDVVEGARPGHITALAENILEKSHFLNPVSAQRIYDEEKEKALRAQEVMKCVILVAKPELGYEVEELDNMTYQEIAKISAMAEQILMIRKAIHDPNMSINIAMLDEETVQMAEERSSLPYDDDLDAWNDPEVRKVRERGTKSGTARVDDPVAQKLKRAMGEL